MPNLDIVARTVRLKRGVDFYPTPYAALVALLQAEKDKIPNVLWEPACGNGALVVPLRNRNFTVTATDLCDWGCPEATGGVDFLSDVAERYRPREPGFGIVTNPPFSIIVPFVERAVELTPYVAMFARLAFLESERRFGWFERVGLARIHVIAERLPMMHQLGYTGPRLSKGALCFAWFIFAPGERGPASLDWVSWKAACKSDPQNFEDLPPVTRQDLGLFAENGR